MSAVDTASGQRDFDHASYKALILLHNPVYKLSNVLAQILNFNRKQAGPWAYGKEKIREAKFARLFGLFPSCQNKFSGETFQIFVDGGERSDYEKFLLDSIFPTKLTEFVPFIFIISQYCPTGKRILPDWLCLPNKLGGGGLSPPPPGTPMGRTILYYYCSH
jgi:hypothetical protein